jgi:hypothetical protein
MRDERGKWETGRKIARSHVLILMINDDDDYDGSKEF